MLYLKFKLPTALVSKNRPLGVSHPHTPSPHYAPVHIIQEVLNRQKIIDESFGKKRFQEHNHRKIKEA